MHGLSLALFLCMPAVNLPEPPRSTILAEAPDFESDVMPILSRAGCNSGACHGAAIGRGGFKLSLNGYDPDSDFDSLVNEFEGRRLNRARPARSLFLLKPTLELTHEGGLRLDPADEGYRVLERWVAGGAPRTRRRTLDRIELAALPAMPSHRPDRSPTDSTARNRVQLDRPGDKFQIQVTAYFREADREQQRDVTRWAIMTPTDPAAISLSDHGAGTVLLPGQNHVLVRYLGHLSCVTVTVPLAPETTHRNRPQANFVDELINRSLDEMGLPHSPRCDDFTWVRRVFLDLIGTLPTPAEVDAFVSDERPDKRRRLVDQLLQRPEYVDLWSFKWGDLLRIESKRLQAEGAAAFHRWVRQCVQADTPLDQMAREMITALGDGYTHGPVNFHRVPSDARGEAEQVSRVFLGVRLQCANCHNHPFDRWTQDDYHGLAAMFARIDRSRMVSALARGEVSHPRTDRPAAVKIPGGETLDDPGLGGRERLAEWLTSPANPYFARAAANRIWRDLMGRGLVEPVDDHRVTNPPTHPELLDRLAGELASNQFRLKHLIRTITGSEAYQRSSRSVPGTAADDRFYSRYMARPLQAPVLVDAISQVTGVAEPFANLPAGTRATELGDAKVESIPLDLLGRCNREADCPTSAAGSLPLTLHAIHGDWLNVKLADPAGLVARSRDPDDAFIQRCYRQALSRPPSDRELSHWLGQFSAAEDATRVRCDFVWALLNSTEFCCNH